MLTVYDGLNSLFLILLPCESNRCVFFLQCASFDHLFLEYCIISMTSSISFYPCSFLVMDGWKDGLRLTFNWERRSGFCFEFASCSPQNGCLNKYCGQSEKYRTSHVFQMKGWRRKICGGSRRNLIKKEEGRLLREVVFHPLMSDSLFNVNLIPLFPSSILFREQKLYLVQITWVYDDDKLRKMSTLFKVL